jgi:F0F1-type ATP synthase membrane subunit c/vacuolar-type H+-ATPase subunit K
VSAAGAGSVVSAIAHVAARTPDLRSNFMSNPFLMSWRRPE